MGIGSPNDHRVSVRFGVDLGRSRNGSEIAPVPPRTSQLLAYRIPLLLLPLRNCSAQLKRGPEEGIGRLDHPDGPRPVLGLAGPGSSNQKAKLAQVIKTPIYRRLAGVVNGLSEFLFGHWSGGDQPQNDGGTRMCHGVDQLSRPVIHLVFKNE